MKGRIHVYTGDGKGKTSAALGVLIRAKGWGMRCFLIQFMKGMETGEVKVLEALGIPVKRFGFPYFPDIKNLKEEEKEVLLAGWEEAKRRMREKIDVLVLDEFSYLFLSGTVNQEEAVEEIKKRWEGMELVLTGREMPPEIVEIADLVTEMRCVRHYFEKGEPPRKGVEF